MDRIKGKMFVCAHKNIYIYIYMLIRWTESKGRCLYVHMNIYIYVNTMDRIKGRCLYVHMEIYIYIC